MSNIELILAFGNLERHFFIIKKNIILALEQFIEPHSLCASKNAMINTWKSCGYFKLRNKLRDFRCASASGAYRISAVNYVQIITSILIFVIWSTSETLYRPVRQHNKMFHPQTKWKLLQFSTASLWWAVPKQFWLIRFHTFRYRVFTCIEFISFYFSICMPCFMSFNGKKTFPFLFCKNGWEREREKFSVKDVWYLVNDRTKTKHNENLCNFMQ